MRAVNDSFVPTPIYLKETTRGKAAIELLDDNQYIGGQRTQSLPQKIGKEIHRILAKNINDGTREGPLGLMLKKIEEKFYCNFMKAEVRISGYAISKTHRQEHDFWSGRIDAVAVRRKTNGDIEFLVVDWKTTANPEVKIETDWWQKATHFKEPLYQCLVYGKLLRAHLKHNGVKANVGIMLLPLHQWRSEVIYPGLCVDFQRMDENHLLQGLKNFKWLAVRDRSHVAVPPITSSVTCNGQYHRQVRKAQPYFHDVDAEYAECRINVAYVNKWWPRDLFYAQTYRSWYFLEKMA